ncbi:MAG: hypothetical protein HYW22_02720 [Candidatus Aenigmarchaeota archaeon]|nr:hypothetical protein [Candidatus Aenigmarchaeota archaeon]
MPRKENTDWSAHKGKFLTTLGGVVLLIGALNYFKVDTNITWMVVGAVLIAKGMWLKHKY